MSEKSNQTLEMMITSLHDDVKEIKIQTKMTNGRVSKLEVWRGFITGGLAVLTFILGYVIYFLEKHV